MNYLTEKEASDKLCCGPCPENTGDAIETGVPGRWLYVCSGSRCAAWVWYIGETNRDRGRCGYIQSD